MDLDLFPAAHQLSEADKSWRSRLDFKTSNSVKKLALKCIVENTHFYVKLYKRTWVNPFDQIYNFMKKDLISLLKSDANSVIDYKRESMKLLLLNKKVLTFSISTYSQYIDEQTWMELAEKCPCLRQLFCKRHRSGRELQLTPVTPILGHLKQMEKLCVLEVDLAFDDDALCILAMSLPKLRVLQVQLLNDGVTKEGFAALSALSELREFIFWNKYTSKQWHLSEILKCLPRLNVVGCRLQAEDDENIDNFSFNLREALKVRQYSEYSVPTKLQLQELELVNFVNMPKNISFPELKLLKLTCTHNHFCTDDFDFAQLTDLILKKYLELFTPLLSVVGFKLQKLSLCFGSKLQLEKVLNLCPNLVEFHVVPFSKDHDCFIIELSNHLSPLPQLRVLKITAFVYAYNKSILFTLLKMMPNLQFLHLNLGSKHLMDDLVLNLQNSVICLQHLQSLTVKLQNKYKDSKVEMEWNRRVEYYSSIFFLQCPFLQDLNIERLEKEPVLPRCGHQQIILL